MQCQICNKNEATIHLTEITDGQRTEMHVCQLCSQEQGIVVQSQMPINELLSNLLASQPTDEQLFGTTDAQQACPHCGFTLGRFQKEAVLGCPCDYEVFEKSLLPLIKKAHAGQTVHCGKVPLKIPKDAKKTIEISGLQKKLENAVKKEDYETAAKLRDKINDYEKQKNETD